MLIIGTGLLTLLYSREWYARFGDVDEDVGVRAARARARAREELYGCAETLMARFAAILAGGGAVVVRDHSSLVGRRVHESLTDGILLHPLKGAPVGGS
jgi:hypothetical protein